MTDLADFLLARIAEDEERYRGLLTRAQRTTLTLQDPKFLGREIPGWFDWPKVEALTARVLAECEAKRRIVEHLARPMVWIGPGPGDFLPGDHRGQADEYLLRLLALPYADHADYREEWKP